jgi:hypothetical protein
MSRAWDYYRNESKNACIYGRSCLLLVCESGSFIEIWSRIQQFESFEGVSVLIVSDHKAIDATEKNSESESAEGLHLSCQ